MDTPEIDPNLRKPRQLRGLPANRFSALFCFGILGAGCTLGLIYNFIPYNRRFMNDVIAGKYGTVSKEQEEFGERMRAQVNVPPGLPSLKSLQAASEKIEKP